MRIQLTQSSIHYTVMKVIRYSSISILLFFILAIFSPAGSYALEVKVDAVPLGLEQGTHIKIILTLKGTIYETLDSIEPFLPLTPQSEWNPKPLFERADIPKEWFEMNKQSENGNAHDDKDHKTKDPLDNTTDTTSGNTNSPDANAAGESDTKAEDASKKEKSTTIGIPPLPQDGDLSIEIVPFPDGKYVQAEAIKGNDKQVTTIIQAQVRIFERIPIALKSLAVNYYVGGELRSIRTPEVEISVHTHTMPPDAVPIQLSPYIDTSQSFFQKPIFFVLLIIAGIGFITLIVLITLKIVNKPKEYGKLKTPYEIAVEEMMRLMQSDLLPQGKIKEFHIQLSEVVRRFLSRTLRIFIMETTTERVPSLLLLRKINTFHIEKVKDFLNICDLVKFAKASPTTDEIDLTYKSGLDIIQRMEQPFFAMESIVPQSMEDPSHSRSVS